MVYVGCYLWWAMGIAIVDWIVTEIKGTGMLDWAKIDIGDTVSVFVENFEGLFAIGGLMSVLFGLILLGVLVGLGIVVVASVTLAVKKKIGFPSLIVGIMCGILAGLIDVAIIEGVLLIIGILLILAFCIFDDSIETVFGPFGWIFWWFK